MSEFQSTLSVRRATLALFQSSPFVDISIHALREESDKSPEYTNPYTHISIHALREESDVCEASFTGELVISIHALREESD